MIGAAGYRVHRGGQGADGLAALLAPGVVCVEAGEAAAPDPLFPEEQAIVAGAVERRRREFALGRSCARRALSLLEQPPAVIPRGPDRDPLWPAGIVGAIAHAGPHCLAVAARSEQWSGLGIDVEQEQELAPGLQRKILTDPERRHLEGLPAGCSWPIAAFSAKEAVFKAWHPRTRRWLDFHDVEICFTPEAGTFEARLLVDDPIYLGRRLERAPGRFLRLPGRVVTSVALS